MLLRVTHTSSVVSICIPRVSQSLHFPQSTPDGFTLYIERFLISGTQVCIQAYKFDFEE